MNLKDSLNKFKESFTDRDLEDQEYGVNEEQPRENPAASVAARPAAVKSAARTSVPSAAQPYKMVVINPVSYKDAEKIADHIKTGDPVVMNMEKTDPDEAERITNFIKGVMYALEGHVDRISDTIFLCTPQNMTIQKEGFTAYSSPAAPAPSEAAPAPDGAPVMDVPQWNFPGNDHDSR